MDGHGNYYMQMKDSFNAKGLQVNMSKTKILVSNPLAEYLVDPSKYPCCVCKRQAGKNPTLNVKNVARKEKLHQTHK